MSKKKPNKQVSKVSKVSEVSAATEMETAAMEIFGPEVFSPSAPASTIPIPTVPEPASEASAPEPSEIKENVSEVSGVSTVEATAAETSETLETPNPTVPPEPAAPASAPAKPLTAAEIKKAETVKIISFLDGLYLELFHCPSGPDAVAYVTYLLNQETDNWRTCAVNSSEFKEFLRHQTYKELGLSIPKAVLAERIDRYSAKAKYDCDEQPVFLRVGKHGEDIFIDLCNNAGQAVKVTAEGWDVVTNPDCKFRRAPGMKSLPVPVTGGSIADLNRFLINLNATERILCVSYIFGAFQHEWPLPILYVTGEFQSGKSRLCQFVQDLIDPSDVEGQTSPRNEHEFAIACHNSWVISLDNLSELSTDLSNALSRRAYGKGVRVRKIFTDTDEILLKGVRPILVNGIGEIATRPDFLSRAIHLHTQDFDKAHRRGEQSLKILFDEKAPRIFGVLLDAISLALKNYPITQLNLPDRADLRMLDFAKWVCAGASALGFTPDQFMNAYAVNLTAGRHDALDASPIYEPLMTLLKQHKGAFEGSTLDLLNKLRPIAVQTKIHDFPKSPHKLRPLLSLITHDLRAEGVVVKRSEKKEGVRKVRTLTITQTNGAQGSEVSKGQK